MAGSFMWLWHVVKDLNVTKLRQTTDAGPDVEESKPDGMGIFMVGRVTPCTPFVSEPFCVTD